MINTDNTVINNLEKIHKTTMGVDRLKKNLHLQTDDIVGWCKKQITNKIQAVMSF